MTRYQPVLNGEVIADSDDVVELESNVCFPPETAQDDVLRANRAGTVALSHRVILLPEFLLSRRAPGAWGPQATVTRRIAASSVAAARSEQNYFR